MSNASELAEFGSVIQPPGDNLVCGVVTAFRFDGTLYTGDLTGDITGNVTGDLTGDVTGNLVTPSGSVTINDTGVNVSSGVVTATVDSGGSSSQFVKGDGSLDNTTYATSATSVSTGKAIAMSMIFG